MHLNPRGTTQLLSLTMSAVAAATTIYLTEGHRKDSTGDKDNMTTAVLILSAIALAFLVMMYYHHYDKDRNLLETYWIDVSVTMFLTATMALNISYMIIWEDAVDDGAITLNDCNSDGCKEARGDAGLALVSMNSIALAAAVAPYIFHSGIFNLTNDIKEITHISPVSRGMELY